MTTKPTNKHRMQPDSLFIDDIKQIVRSARHKAYSALILLKLKPIGLLGKESSFKSSRAMNVLNMENL